MQGAFYEIATLLTTESGQPDYYTKKPVTKEMAEETEGNLKFVGVNFHYPTKKDVLVTKNMNLKINNTKKYKITRIPKLQNMNYAVYI